MRLCHFNKRSLGFLKKSVFPMIVIKHFVLANFFYWFFFSGAPLALRTHISAKDHLCFANAFSCIAFIALKVNTTEHSNVSDLPRRYVSFLVIVSLPFYFNCPRYVDVRNARFFSGRKKTVDRSSNDVAQKSLSLSNKENGTSLTETTL